MDRKQRKISAVCGIISLVSSLEACKTAANGGLEGASSDLNETKGGPAESSAKAREARDRLSDLIRSNREIRDIVREVRARGNAVMLDVNNDEECEQLSSFFSKNARSFKKNKVGYMFVWNDSNTKGGKGGAVEEGSNNKGGNAKGGKGGVVITQPCAQLPEGVSIAPAYGKEGPSVELSESGEIQIRMVVDSEVRGGWTGSNETKLNNGKGGSNKGGSDKGGSSYEEDTAPSYNDEKGGKGGN